MLNMIYVKNEIVGYPSGEVLHLTEAEIDYLKSHSLIKWSGSRTGIDNYIGYYYHDINYNKIMNLLYSLY